MKILIVDDNQDLAEGFADFLEDDGYDISVVATGKDALAALQTKEMDVVFMDFKLPDMTGLEIYRSLERTSPNTKVVMMTGYRVEQLLAEISGNGQVYVQRNSYNSDLLSLTGELKDDDIMLLTYQDKNAFSSMLATLSEERLVAVITELSQVKHARDYTALYVFDTNDPVIAVLSQCLALREQGVSAPMVLAMPETVSAEDPLRSVSGTGCLFKPFLPSEMKKIIERVANGEF